MNIRAPYKIPVQARMLSPESTTAIDNISKLIRGVIHSRLKPKISEIGSDANPMKIMKAATAIKNISKRLNIRVSP